MNPSFDVDTALAHLRRDDPPMARLIDAAGPFDLESRSGHSPFQVLVRAILSQQLSGKAATTIYNRVLALVPNADGLLHPDDVLAVPDDAIRGAGVSRAKTAAIKDLAMKTLDGTVPEQEALFAMPDDEVIQRLTTVRGIGRWTAEMLLIFYLTRPDVLPVTDLGVQKGFMLTYGLDALPKPKELASYGERWKPYRSVASWYLWRAVDG